MANFCLKHKDCLANNGGRCEALDNTYYVTKDCPFYRTAESKKINKKSKYENIRTSSGVMFRHDWR